MTQFQQIVTIALLALAVVATRFLPFILFPPGRRTPSFIAYLGRVLPLAVFGMLVVYCLKDVRWLRSPYGLPELVGIAATILVHVWYRQMLWSIAAGTLIYMLITRMM